MAASMNKRACRSVGVILLLAAGCAGANSSMEKLVEPPVQLPAASAIDEIEVAFSSSARIVRRIADRGRIEKFQSLIRSMDRDWHRATDVRGGPCLVWNIILKSQGRPVAGFSYCDGMLHCVKLPQTPECNWAERSLSDEETSRLFSVLDLHTELPMDPVE